MVNKAVGEYSRIKIEANAWNSVYRYNLHSRQVTGQKEIDSITDMYIGMYF